MGRHSLPNEIHQRKGSTKVNPGRFPTTVPKSRQSLGDCPGWFDDYAKEFWTHVVACAPRNVLTGMDREILSVACELHSLWRTKGIEAVPAAKIALLISCCARLGMSPADRTRLGTNESNSGENEFD